MSAYDYIGLSFTALILTVMGLAIIGDMFEVFIYPYKLKTKLMQVAGYTFFLWLIYKGLLWCYLFYING